MIIWYCARSLPVCLYVYLPAFSSLRQGVWFLEFIHKVLICIIFWEIQKKKIVLNAIHYFFASFMLKVLRIKWFGSYIWFSVFTSFFNEISEVPVNDKHNKTISKQINDRFIIENKQAINKYYEQAILIKLIILLGWEFIDIRWIVAYDFFWVMFQHNGEFLWHYNLLGAVDSLFSYVSHSLIIFLLLFCETDSLYNWNFYLRERESSFFVFFYHFICQTSFKCLNEFSEEFKK